MIFDHKVPTTTAYQHRIRLFQPTRRPVHLNGVEVESSYGSKVKITGKLGQAHADVLESIMFCCERKRDLEDGRIKILVDPYQVQKHASLSSRKQLSVLLIEIMSAVINVDVPSRKIHGVGHLIDHVKQAVGPDGHGLTRVNPIGIATANMAGNQARVERAMWRVDIGKALTQFLQGDIWMTYDPTPISKLRHGISQALARHVRTHDCTRQPRGGWWLDGLIMAVGGEQAGLRDRRREVRADTAELAGLGVLVNHDRVQRVEHSPGCVE